jgi:hypothetical protein
VRRIVLPTLVAAGVVGVYLLTPPAARPLPDPPTGLAASPRGALHIHTRRSDGSGTVDDVAAAAARAGLQFVIVTDHGDATRTPDPPSYRSGVLVIDGVEISTWAGHVVALGLPAAPYPIAGEPRDVIEDILRLGGFGIAAHPVNEKASSRWAAWDEPFGGIEWLNGDSEWRDESPQRLARVLLVYAFRHVETLGLLLDRDDEVMRRWDALTARRRVVAVAGADAHARVGLPSARDPLEGRALLRMPGYEAMFRAFGVALPALVLSGDAAGDAQAVLDEIRAGRVFSSVDAIAPRPAFAFTAASGANRAVGGEPLPIDGPVQLRVDAQAPPDARLVLIRDGVAVQQATGTSLQHDADATPAVYRVEVMLPGAPGEPPVPWIVSNPIYVGRPVTEPAPEPPVRPPAVEKRDLYTNGPATGWTVEHGQTAQGALDVVEAVGGTQLMLRYALSGAASASPFAALAVPAVPGLAQYDRLAFVARADRPMRIWVQARLPGTEGRRWRRSVYVDETPREVVVPFDDMTPLSPELPAHPPLDEVQSILVVVDTINTVPGTAGRLTIDEVRVEKEER